MDHPLGQAAGLRAASASGSASRISTETAADQQSARSRQRNDRVIRRGADCTAAEVVWVLDLRPEVPSPVPRAVAAAPGWSCPIGVSRLRRPRPARTCSNGRDGRGGRARLAAGSGSHGQGGRISARSRRSGGAPWSALIAGVARPPRGRSTVCREGPCRHPSCCGAEGRPVTGRWSGFRAPKRGA